MVRERHQLHRPGPGELDLRRVAAGLRLSRSLTRTVGRPLAFWFVAYAFFAVTIGTTLPTPLYPIYQQRFGFSQLLITIIFASYAVAVLAGLFLFGRLSDDLGRRGLLIPGVLLSALSAIAFVIANGLTPILIGRILSGLSAAIFTGTATAAMLDLAPDDQRLRATTIAVAANLGGLATGQLLSGVLAQYGPLPVQLSFIVDLFLLVPAALVILLIPETVTISARQWRLQRVSVPPEVRQAFVPAAITGFCGFAIFGVFGSLVPTFFARSLHLPNHALLGLIVGLLLAFSAVGQVAVTRISERVALPIGCIGFILGTALVGAGIGATSLWPLIAATPILGLSQGLVVGSGLAAINKRAPAQRRGEVASTYFLALFVGLSIPVVAVGFASDAFGLRTAGLLVSGTTIAVVSVVGIWVLRRPIAD
jgi:MFS family permease